MAKKRISRKQRKGNKKVETYSPQDKPGSKYLDCFAGFMWRN